MILPNAINHLFSSLVWTSNTVGQLEIDNQYNYQLIINNCYIKTCPDVSTGCLRKNAAQNYDSLKISK